jgi:ABC-2 type transport system ATP-binding protein
VSTDGSDLAIEASGLGRDYGAFTAVGAVDLAVRRGEFFGFLGPNGAGKTTTIRMLTTLLKPTRGTALVGGKDIRRDTLGVRRGIGVVFQETTLDLDLTAEENLRFATRLYGLSRGEARARIDEALALFGLVERRHDRVRTFSGGMRRALDLARGVLHRPELLFLDEPTLGLDPAQRRRIWGFLRHLCDELGTTLFLTTHYLQEADPCDRVAIVDRGAVIALDRPTALKRQLGGETVELEGGDPAELAAQVTQLTGIRPHVNERGVALVGTPPADVLPRLMPLVEAGVRLEVSRPTLEDVFVHLTERKEVATP